MYSILNHPDFDLPILTPDSGFGYKEEKREKPKGKTEVLKKSKTRSLNFEKKLRLSKYFR